MIIKGEIYGRITTGYAIRTEYLLSISSYLRLSFIVMTELIGNDESESIEFKMTALSREIKMLLAAMTLV